MTIEIGASSPGRLRVKSGKEFAKSHSRASAKDQRLSCLSVPGIMVYKNRLPFRSGIGYLSQGFPRKTYLTLDLDCDPCLEERVGNVVTGVGVRLARSLEQGEAGWLLS
ncbi:hypothetical protein DKX38_030087 (mitochondrion) [Salix brachista]|uniref:Uncharacterized protein n=1 Tax=Salix brachista TaxID=2182728 RepID=A0A5N5IX02_9ROSI|nr:hypothetical protein DKX38_030087 [Salix brachista]